MLFLAILNLFVALGRTRNGCQIFGLILFFFCEYFQCFVFLMVFSFPEAHFLLCFSEICIIWKIFLLSKTLAVYFPKFRVFLFWCYLSGCVIKSASFEDWRLHLNQEMLSWDLFFNLFLFFSNQDLLISFFSEFFFIPK